MAQNWRYSLWSKLAAAGFISLILLGNIWFVMGLGQNHAPQWLQILFVSNVVWLLGTGFGLGAYLLLQLYRSRSNSKQYHHPQE